MPEPERTPGEPIIAVETASFVVERSTAIQI
jgi:hypothetical protein